MKKLIIMSAATAALAACHSSVDVKYVPYGEDEQMNSCRYVEDYKDRSGMFGFMGGNNIHVQVNYEGTKCEKVITADLQRGAAKNAMFKAVKNDADVVVKRGE